MATIYIDNIVKPEKVFSKSPLNKETNISNFVYKDLHLDLTIKQNVGNGIGSVDGNDIMADYDLNAIKNSLYNIFNSRKGFKALDPDFGCSLDQYLFEKITESNAFNLGTKILTNIEKYEPRIYVSNVQVIPFVESNQYYVTIYYSILNIKRDEILNLQFESNKTIIL